ncbi:GerAB/ArcD/ProY family transporter [Paenibacillus eucommiae]|uniref:Spore germination protein KB n=1 Tax=Paenibacillus eucommiae TaxID=1355755 RepID=A0ABS4IXE8_9BACL|nr:endospore germination permease [Paenibacillus eucommiae]MBP1992238.1 spore germination protein KB [Paenibacillus eucommiae]
MLETGRISIRQFTILVALITVGDSILILPAIPASEAKQDAWLSGIVGLIVGLLVVYLIGTVGRLYPRLNLIEYNTKILGSWIGTAVSLFFLLYFFYNAAALVRVIGDFMVTQIMPETPIDAIHILFLGVIVMGLRLGLETVARAGEIFLPWFVLLFLGLVMFLTPLVDAKQLQPILTEGIKPILRGSLFSATNPYIELVAFLMIFPYVNKTEKLRKYFVSGALLGGIVLVVMIALSILVLGVDFTSRNMYPSYALAKQISIGRFIERLEAIMAIMWILTLFIKTSVYVYILQLGLAQVLKLKDFRALVLPLAYIIAASATVLSPNITYFNRQTTTYWPYFDMTFGVGLPLLLLGVHALRRRGGT